MMDAGLPVPAFFTDRSSGASLPPYDANNLALHVGDEQSHVHLNRDALERRLGVRVAYMSQIHSAHVRVVVNAQETPEGDALVTATPGLGLAVLVADCAPVLLADPTAGVVAAVHVGRAGMVAGVLLEAFGVMIDHGASPEHIHVAVGPTICGDCYEVPTAMRASVEDSIPGTARTTSWGTPSLDIRAGIDFQCAQAGVRKVTHQWVCPRENSDYFSYRRDGVTGRFAGVIVNPQLP